MRKKVITNQQKVFIEEYLKLRKKNQRQAAINAGYSSKSADSQASQLLKNPKVIAYLEEREKLLEQDLRREFLFDALEARNILYSIMNEPEANFRDRLNAAKVFLDLAGIKHIDKMDKEKKQAEIIKIKAEADLAKHEADMVVNKDGETNTLLKALLDVQLGENGSSR